MAEATMATSDEAQGRQDRPVPQPIEVDSIPDGPMPGEQVKNKPGRQRGTDDSFTGRAAQLAVVAELLRLRCNAAIPEVDLGTDVFVFKDDREAVVRLQVKACTVPHAYADGSGYSAKFALPMKQFEHLDDYPPLYYVLAVLRNERWADFLVVSRARLQSYYNGNKPFGSLNKKNNNLEITVEFRAKVECSEQDLTDCRNTWRSLPPLQTAPGSEPVVQVELGTAGLVGTDPASPAEPGQA
jgi:hypothetical protein